MPKYHACGRNVNGGLTFHDLRHTFVTDMRKAGVPEKLIMKITGHSTREMFDRYNTITAYEKSLANEQLTKVVSQNNIYKYYVTCIFS
jgi:integrase